MARSLSFSPRYHPHRHHPPHRSSSTSSSSSLSSSPPSSSAPCLPHAHHPPSMHPPPHHHPRHPHPKHLPKHLLKHSHKKLHKKFHKKLHKFHKLHQKLHAHHSFLFPPQHPFAHFHPCCSLIPPPPPEAVRPPPAAADAPLGDHPFPPPEPPMQTHSLGFEELSLYARSFRHDRRHGRCIRPCHSRRLRSRVILEHSDPGTATPKLGSQEPEFTRDEAGLQQGGSAPPPPMVDMIPVEPERNTDEAGPSNA